MLQFMGSHIVGHDWVTELNCHRPILMTFTMGRFGQQVIETESRQWLLTETEQSMITRVCVEKEMRKCRPVAQNFSFARWISTEDLLYNSVSIVNSIVSYTSNWRNPVSPNVAFWIIIIQYQNKETDMATIYMYISTSFYHMCWLVQAISIQNYSINTEIFLVLPLYSNIPPPMLCYAKSLQSCPTLCDPILP